ncbi:MAG: PilN domain-containing protein [Deltaproteobacteria bacterium]|nr:PilN domain-containing protein [Deltaproteobacteria bacterium]
MIKINLLPFRIERRREFIRKQLSILALSLILALAVMGILYFQIQTKISRTRATLTKTNQQIKDLEPIVKKIEFYKKQKEDLGKKIAVIIELDRNRPAPVVILADLNRQRPEKLWFISLKENSGVLSLSGVAIDNETIVSFLENLKLSPLLKKAELELLRARKFEGFELKEFTINCPIDKTSLPEALLQANPEPRTDGLKIEGADNG